MAIRLVLVLLATFRLTAAASQDSKFILLLEKTVTGIDSIIGVGVNIGEYIHPLFADDCGDIFLKHHYTIDTMKKIFYKAVYDDVRFEQVTFYYSDQKIIKAIVSDTSSKRKPYKCEYYFENDSIISIKEQGIPDSKNSWNKKIVTLQAKQYLIDFFGICDMLDERK